jgi:hypothetical protein
MSSAGREIFKLGYEISPIILVNGIAINIPGQMLPIVALTEATNFAQGLLQGNLPALDQYFAHWKPLPGTELLHNLIAMYPFANQSVAANAIITQPLQISMLMNCPVQSAGGYTSKLATMTLLMSVLKQHSLSGGTFTVATPSGLFANCILSAVRDVSSGDSKQAQHTFQFDFLQPLITLDQTAQVYNSLMSKISAGLPTSQTPAWSGVDATVGVPSPTPNVNYGDKLGYPFSLL